MSVSARLRSLRGSGLLLLNCATVFGAACLRSTASATSLVPVGSVTASAITAVATVTTASSVVTALSATISALASEVATSGLGLLAGLHHEPVFVFAGLAETTTATISTTTSKVATVATSATTATISAVTTVTTVDTVATVATSATATTAFTGSGLAFFLLRDLGILDLVSHFRCALFLFLRGLSLSGGLVHLLGSLGPSLSSSGSLSFLSSFLLISGLLGRSLCFRLTLALGSEVLLSDALSDLAVGEGTNHECVQIAEGDASFADHVSFGTGQLGERASEGGVGLHASLEGLGALSSFLSHGGVESSNGRKRSAFGFRAF